jgi:hypothetical protein
VTPARRLLQRALPVVVSLGLLAWLLASFDIRAILGAVDARVAAVLLPCVLVWGTVTLGLEAISIYRLLPARPASFTLGTAARIKCASYMLGIIHLALGGAGLTVLLRRSTGVTLGRAAGLVLLIMLTDLVVTLSAGVLGTTFSAQAAAALPVGLLGAIAAAIVLGVALLRAPARMGPLESIRSLSVFVALRETPLPRLLELFAVRCLFVS